MCRHGNPDPPTPDAIVASWFGMEGVGMEGVGIEGVGMEGVDVMRSGGYPLAVSTMPGHTPGKSGWVLNTRAG